MAKMTQDSRVKRETGHTASNTRTKAQTSFPLATPQRKVPEGPSRDTDIRHELIAQDQRPTTDYAYAGHTQHNDCTEHYDHTLHLHLLSHSHSQHQNPLERWAYETPRQSPWNGIDSYRPFTYASTSRHQFQDEIEDEQDETWSTAQTWGSGDGIMGVRTVRL